MPRIGVLAAVVVAAVVVAVVLTNSGGPQARGEVFLQPAAATGPDPFTASSATGSDTSTAQPPQGRPSGTAPTAPSGTGSAAPNTLRGISGGAPGLYTGTHNSASCDVEKQIKDLRADPARNAAFASTVGVSPSGVPGYLRSLTPVQLGMDTRVTAHGYRDGSVTTYQSVLQTGTAVLVDAHGVPRTRCACGNPLSPPVAQSAAPKYTGQSWASYRPQNVVVVTPAPRPVKTFVVYDPGQHKYFSRDHGDHGGKDHWTEPPKHPPAPSASVTLPSSTPPSASKPGSPGSAPPSRPSGKPSSAPPKPPGSSNAPSSNAPSSHAPSSAPSSQPPSSHAPPPSSPPPSQPSQPATPSAPPSSGPPSNGSPAQPPAGTPPPPAS
ncbi:hypothetical protein GCM10010508_11540 [Streptomyces naganishii JCM 4654]|uniref:DUF6777 domain-containing protein n=1 Tax=Streptomyces naganishii JCM 4654 TaxID=1306179 RepID=A0A919CTQ2_9ACTN|nr:hypothetical protein GCM10010508_11540 [Streptomyces naganishii JCM 4654]